MATIYGNNVGSTWRAMLSYTLSETDTNYIINLGDARTDYYQSKYWIDPQTSDAITHTISYSDNGADTTVDTYTSNTDADHDANDNLVMQKTVDTITIPKSSADRVITLTYAISLPHWIRMSDSGYSTITNSVSTATASITIPKLGSPSITSVDVIRDDDTPTTLYVTPYVTSYDGDTFTVSMTYDGLETPITLNNGVVNTVTGFPEDPTTVYVTATGEGGTSAAYTVTVPVAFHTFLTGANGKSAAFGKLPATVDEIENHPNGLWECAMDAQFEGDSGFDTAPTIGGHDSPVGTVITETLDTTVSLSTSWKSIHSITLTKGTWIVYGRIRSSATLSAARTVSWSMATTSGNTGTWSANYTASGYYVADQITIPFEITDDSATIYINAVASGSVTIGTATRLTAIRIA